MVVQQCLNALVFLTQYNGHIPSFFLSEHQTSSSSKSKSSRKGKGKEIKASNYPLNALLSLLDRKIIMESSSCMEQLSSLLQNVTHPLTLLLRREKESGEPPKEDAEKSTRPAAQTSEGPTTDLEAENPQSVTEDQAAGIRNGPQDSTTNESAEQLAENPTEEMPDARSSEPPVEPNVHDQEANGGQSTSTVPGDAKSIEEAKSKKARSLTPPVVPRENLRLVVNILAARECSAKTFRDTLSTINNLSAIPDAMGVFGEALIEQSLRLCDDIHSDLASLDDEIRTASSATDIQNIALAKFAPASSDQSKLLRVLTALDYLFDPKRNGGKVRPAADPESGNKPSLELSFLYENPNFQALWEKLSMCLVHVRETDSTLNIATILLPLIETLMVVCKGASEKDLSSSLKAAKDFSVTSPPPESRAETLFFRFTEEHRKVLNDLVRQNPKLMSGTFSLLVKNPKVLEFDNKRNYFNRRLRSRGPEARHPQPPLQLSVRRDQVFMDSYKNLSFKSGDEIKYGKLSVRFSGEEGVDAGGVTREWFQVLSRQMFNADYALFDHVASDRTTFHPNKLSKVNEEHLMFFKFIGRIIGKALYEGRALDCHFSRAVYKRILGKTVSIKDMESLDLDYYKSLLWMLENDITEIITETFSIVTDDFGVTETVDLVENGRNIPVTEDNKHEYVQLVVEYRLTGSVQGQLDQFLSGKFDFSITFLYG